VLTRNNIRSKYFYSPSRVKEYPLGSPSSDQYAIYKENIEHGCTRVNGKVTVLEIGCGTGRYFHFLKNIETLVGVDISELMLERAKGNLKNMPGLGDHSRLIQNSIEELEIDDKFDFIYSIGTLGEYCLFNVSLLNKIVGLLKPGGFLFFTIVDSESYVTQKKLTVKTVLKDLLRLLPDFVWIRVFNKYMSTDDFKHLFMSQSQINTILESCSSEIQWEITKAKDKKHVHHICKVWLQNGVVRNLVDI